MEGLMPVGVQPGLSHRTWTKVVQDHFLRIIFALERPEITGDWRKNSFCKKLREEER
jgi:hypothetical protein